MAGRFPLYTDADVRGPLIKALTNAGWDMVRAIDELAEGTKDPPHFERAVELGRVLVTNDSGQETRAQQWYEAKRSFPGLIVWRQAVYDQVSYGQLVEAFEEIARQTFPSRSTRSSASGLSPETNYLRRGIDPALPQLAFRVADLFG